MQSDNTKEVVTMEDHNKTKLNKFAADLPEVEELKPEELPRRPDGKIDIEKITLGKSKRNNDIVPDDFFDKHYRELPDKVENASGSWRTVSTGGKIKIFGADPEEDKKIQRMGADKLNAAKAQQRTFKEVIAQMLADPAKSEDIDRLGLTEGATQLEVIIAGQLQQAGRGNSKAAEFLRDTVGEKPTEKLDASITALTAEDKELIANVERRLSAADDNS